MEPTIHRCRSILLRAMVGLAVMWAPSLSSRAHADQPGPSADPEGVATVIHQQLAAFDRGDALGAWAPMAPGLRARFGTPEGYLAQVREGYAPLVNSHQRLFGEQMDLPSGEIGQWIDVVGADGQRVRALYLLEQIDGRWRTTGCLLFDGR